MSEPKNGFTAKPCIFNDMTNGFMLYQYVGGVLVVSQFVADLPEWCKATGVPLESIQIIEG